MVSAVALAVGIAIFFGVAVGAFLALEESTDASRVAAARVSFLVMGGITAFAVLALFINTLTAAVQLA